MWVVRILLKIGGGAGVESKFADILRLETVTLTDTLGKLK